MLISLSRKAISEIKFKRIPFNFENNFKNNSS